MWETIEDVEHAIGGQWPVAGGLLDQTAAFMAAFELVVSQKSKYELERIKALERLYER